MKTLFQLSEAVEKHHVTAFTRMNPPTTGHMQLIDKVHSVAKEHSADHSVVVSHSQDPKKNPLSSDQKKKHLKRFSSETNVVASSKEHPTILHHLSSLHKAGVTHAHIVAGSDRHAEMHKLTNAYNGKKAGHGYYKFKKITIHSAGERDPDAEGTSGISATKQREHAASGNFKEFRKGVPSHVSDEHTKDLMNDVRNGQKTKKNEGLEMESLDNLFEKFMIEDSDSFSDAELWNVVDQTSFSDLDPNENDSDFIETLVGESIEEDLDESRVLSILQRQRAKMKFKQRQPRMKRMRELKRKRMATPQRLTYRARTSALMMLRKRIAGQKGLSYHKLPPSQRYAIDKAVQARYGKNLDKLVGTLSKRTLPMIRKKEMTRLAKARGQNVTMPAQSKSLYQSYDVREDSDYISTNNDHLLTPKVNMLLRLGLVDQDEIEKYRRALKIGEKALSSPELRSKILSMLDKILKMATDDPQTFARIRAMVVLKKKSQNEEKSISKDPLENDPLEADPLENDKMDPTPKERHLTLRKKMIRQHESKTFTSLREKMKDQYDPLAEDKIAESLYNKSVKYNVSIDSVVEVYEAALKNSGNENVAFDAVNSFLANLELDEVQRRADVNRVKVRLPDGSIVWRNDRRSTGVQDEEVEDLDESGFHDTLASRGDADKDHHPQWGAATKEWQKAHPKYNKERTKDIKSQIKGRIGRGDYAKKSNLPEEVEQMDEAPLRAVSALVGYPKLNRKIASKGTPGSEDERNKAAAGLRKDRSGLGRRAYTGDQHYDVRREDVDKKDSVMMDIPLLIRVLELAREDLKTDMDLHKVVEKLINMRTKGILTMDDYDYIAHIKEQVMKEGHYEDADEHMSKANDSDAEGDKLSFHHHMANYHDSMSQWHESKGRSDAADTHAEKADIHSEKATDLARRVREDVDADSIFEIEMYVPEIHEARGDHLLTIQGGRGKGRKFMHKDTSVDDHLSAMEFHLKGYHAAKKDKLDATKNHHAKMYHKHKDQIEALGGVGNHLKESNAHKILAKKIQQMAIRKKMTDDALARHNAEQEKAEKEKKQGVAEEGGAGEFGTAELTKNYARETPGQCQEILNMKTSDMGDVIKDFKKSDAPQFKGKSVEKRRQMAIAAKLSSQDKE